MGEIGVKEARNLSDEYIAEAVKAVVEQLRPNRAADLGMNDGTLGSG
jgi:hypothetical protein